MKKRILLISPDKTPDKGYAQMMQHREELMSGGAAAGLKAVMAPVELATLAALTPPEFEVDCWDEAVSGTITPDTDLGAKYDLVGVTGYLAHVVRMIEIRNEFHRRGVMTVAGGPAVSGSPERFRGIFDVIFLGEAEFTWPNFLHEWVKGEHQAEYRQIERPELSKSPVPLLEKIKNVDTAYVVGGVQTTRGCPFDCEFCDVIHLFGRKPRSKPIDHVLEEIKSLEKLGVKRVFFCDDNFIGSPSYAKDLLRKLIPLNNSFKQPLGYMTQLTINVARDEEMMQLLAEANFWQVHVGIETPRMASLMEVNKVQNTRGNLVEDVLKLQSYGVMVKALMMVGFDNDDQTIFDELYTFIQTACIPTVQLSLLQAYPGTPQTARLLKAGRVLDMDRYAEMDDTYGVSNVIPAKMTREELFAGFLEVEERLRSWKAFGERMVGAVRNIKYTPSNVDKLMKPDPARLMELQKLIMSLEPEAQEV
ncbi:MAG: B12-binding domain-containing radical SAM protein, partial [Deltaproteobacteria bacterium]|nr:B12-binding domain-containing radical SAM protein [Deltaproteobacteria bacterium]